jgi:oxygen-independent coproporphyrinogen-3 oxidase
MANRVIPIVGLAPAGGASAVSALPTDDGGIRLSAVPPLSLYVHFPWCVRKCPYCDFNSHEAREAPDFEAYVDALIRDLQGALPMVWGRPVVSVFFGGGTPSLVPIAAFSRLMDSLRTLLNLQPGLEVTLEANPGTAEEARFAGYAAAGVNRISLGVQSFDDAMLARLGRIHGGDDSRRAVDMALRHVPRVNIDLMHALPRQTPAGAVADVRLAIARGIGHISAYQLTLEPNTAFAADPPADLPEADAAADVADTVEAELAQAGYEHYETSAHARSGERCLHNLNYWAFGDYLGIGAGAHSKLSFAERIVRHARFRHPRTYLDKAAQVDPVADGVPATIEEARDLRTDELPFEFALNALRLTAGCDAALYTAHAGRPSSDLLKRLDAARRLGLVDVEAGKVRPTRLGRRHLNTLLETLLP